MSAEYDDDMIVLPEGNPREPRDENEALIQQIMEATADVFSKISYLLRDARSDVPAEAMQAFREIVGAACRAHGDIIAECLPEPRRKFLAQLAEALTERALDAIADRRTQKEAAAAPSEPPPEDLH